MMNQDNMHKNLESPTLLATKATKRFVMAEIHTHLYKTTDGHFYHVDQVHLNDLYDPFNPLSVDQAIELWENSENNIVDFETAFGMKLEDA